MIIERCVRERLPLPQAIANAPELFLGLELYYQAFLDLTSCRGTGYGTEGPIPWTAMVQWADEYELDDDQRGDLYRYIPVMDEVYLKFKGKKLAAANKAPPAPKGPRAGRRR